MQRREFSLRRWCCRHRHVDRRRQQPAGEGSYEYDGRALTADQKLGRDTWYFWTAGNQKFWRQDGRHSPAATSIC